MKIMLLNDTGNRSHIGCLAVSNAHNKLLAEKNHQVVYRHYNGEMKSLWQGNEEKCIKKILEILEKEILNVDCVVVNGEGTIHHNRGLHLIATLGAAQQLGKKTALINSVFQEIDFYIDVFKKLDFCSVREILSSKELEKKDISHETIFDSCLEAEWLENSIKDYKDSMLVTDYIDTREHDVGRAIKEFSKEHSCIKLPLMSGVNKTSWKHEVANLKTAKLLITGRHHGIYLAGMAGIPFVALPSNTHKIEGIIRSTGLPIPICTSKNDIEKAVKYALENTSIFKEFSNALKQSKPLKIFDFML